jgi:hypothetical protein
MTNDALPTNRALRNSREHLSAEQLTRYLDGDLTPDELRAADFHLSGCEGCAEELGDLTAISSLLGSLPRARVPRSFQLDQSHARKTTSVWQRFGAALLPALPAMRAGTIAVALAFASVTAYRVVDDGAQPEDIAMIAQPTASLIEATATTSLAGRAADTATVVFEVEATADVAGDETGDSAPAEVFSEEDAISTSPSQLAPAGGDDASLDEDAPEPTNETTDTFEGQESDGQGASAEAESANLEIAQAAPVDASPTAEPTSTATATALPTATSTATAAPVAPTPLPTEMPAPVAEEGSDEPSWLGWAQAVLGVMLALLGGLVVGVHRLRRKVTG